MFDDFQDMDESMDDAISAYEPDEPEGLLAPRDSTLCIGHNKTEQTLIDLINSGAMPHALIFHGPEGIGKATMAFRFARYMLKNPPQDDNQDSLFGDSTPAEDAATLDVPQDDVVFSKVAAGGHPDLLTIERAVDAKKGAKKKNLDVETARKVVPFLRMTSSDGGWRIVIVDDADSMNRNAQNALLKILEEPPKNTVLILITHRLGAMIPTIRSRCRVINFEPLDEQDFTTLIAKEVGGTISAEEQNLLAHLSSGSVGQAQRIIESNGLETANNVLGILNSAPDFNWVDIHHMAENIGRTAGDDAFKNVQNTFLWIAEEIIFSKAKGFNNLPGPLQTDAIQSMSSEKSLQQWLEIFENLKSHFSQVLFSNLDKKQGILAAFNIIQSK